MEDPGSFVVPSPTSRLPDEKTSTDFDPLTSLYGPSGESSRSYTQKPR